MATVRIAHLSDLHFDATKNLDVWRSVVTFITQTVRPAMVLVTGDVTDNASFGEFELAVRSLEALNVERKGAADDQPYRIVPGNHDRFLYRGNSAVTKLQRLLGGRPKDKAARFDAAFRGALHVTPGGPASVTLCDGGAEWNVRIVGLDSCESPQWFAQGHVELTSIEAAARSALAAADSDLVIALVHHHVLPIPALERARGNAFKTVANVTGLLNSGTLLTQLSNAQVNLVLHGHEHQRNQARFASNAEDASELVVLAAGSGTGEKTLEGWQLDRVHCNVIELRDDRSVWLREVGYSADLGTLTYLGSPRLLLEAADIAKSRFLRRNRRPQPGGAASPQERRFPRSRLKKVVRITPERHVEISETRTDWIVRDVWEQVARNATGSPGPLTVTFDWTVAPGEPPQAQEFDGEFLVSTVDPDQHVCSLPLPHPGRTRHADRVTSAWTWIAGGLLTRAEATGIPTPGPYRAQGLEFAAVDADGELEALVLTIELPPGLCPPAEAFQVRAGPPSAGPDGALRLPELERGLEFGGRGVVELRVPYPTPGFRYVVTWPLADRDPRAASERSLAAWVRRDPALALARAREVLERGFATADVRLSLYVRDDERYERLAAGDPGAPDGLRIVDARGLARAAVFGDIVIAVRSGGDDEPWLGRDETALVLFPIRRLLNTASEVIFRVGLRIPLSDAFAGAVAEREVLNELRALVAQAGAAVLASVRAPS